MSSSTTNAATVVGGRKDNENPEIFVVKTRRSASDKARTLKWSNMGMFQLHRRQQQMVPAEDPSTSNILSYSIITEGSFVDNGGFNGGGDNDNVIFPWTPTTAEDKAILKNLTDVSHATRKGSTSSVGGGASAGGHHHDSGVCLLESCGGLVIPTKRVAAQVLLSTSPIFPINNNITVANDDADRGAESKEDHDEEFSSPDRLDDSDDDEIDAAEIFDIIRNIQDPEHPHTLEELGVVSLEQVELTTTTTDVKSKTAPSSLVTVSVRFTPTIPHCSMATLIGLCIRVKLLRSLPSRRFQVSVQIEPGTHASENAINKQLRDKGTRARVLTHSCDAAATRWG